MPGESISGAEAGGSDMRAPGGEGRVLLLGGTSEANALAEALARAGRAAVYSYAGRVNTPRARPLPVRIGGFGGAEGLADYLRAERIVAVVDATHPFAERITANAAAACRIAGLPLLRLSRPGWGAHPGAGTWHWVTDFAAAKLRAEQLGERLFLTTGRGTLPHFAGWTDRYVLVRLVEAPATPLPNGWELLVDRGPFSIEHERALLRDRRIDVLVTKDSGGAATAAKLDAAGEEVVPVVIVARPADPEGVPVVDSVADAHNWLLGRASHR